MNLRVLIYMNPLVVDKIAKKFIYDKDSGFIFTRNMIKELPTDWRYSILVPKGINRSFFPQTHVIDLLEYNYSTSIHQNRYHFNRELLAKYFPYGTDVDVVLCNQPEIAANISTFFFNQRREKPIIINFFHWIDCSLSQKFGKDLGGYIWRQIDGALSADVNYFHTPYAYRLFTNELSLLGLQVLDNGIQCSTHVKTITRDYFSVKPTIFGSQPIDLPDKKIILFNHRMNESTGWQEVLDACIELRKVRNDFYVWFTDEQKIDQKERLAQYDWVITKRVPFQNYGYLMENSHFSVCNLIGYATWNLSVLDSIANNCYPLIRDTELLRSLATTAVTFSSQKELAQSMNHLLNMPVEKLHSAVKYMQPTLPSGEMSIEKNIAIIIKTRLDSKIPAKYDLVKQDIINGLCRYKKDWVNKFWSFHANGNFQKIRWRLLSEGMSDDIRETETKYYVLFTPTINSLS